MKGHHIRVRSILPNPYVTGDGVIIKKNRCYGVSFALFNLGIDKKKKTDKIKLS